MKCDICGRDAPRGEYRMLGSRPVCNKHDVRRMDDEFAVIKTGWLPISRNYKKVRLQ